jgi:hypothetical protein
VFRTTAHQGGIMTLGQLAQRRGLEKSAVGRTVRNVVVQEHQHLLPQDPNLEHKWTEQRNGQLLFVGSWRDILRTMTDASQLCMKINLSRSALTGGLEDPDELGGASLYPGEGDKGSPDSTQAIMKHMKTADIKGHKSTFGDFVVSASTCGPLTSDTFTVIYDPNSQFVKNLRGKIASFTGASPGGILGQAAKIGGVGESKELVSSIGELLEFAHNTQETQTDVSVFGGDLYKKVIPKLARRIGSKIEMAASADRDWLRKQLEKEAAYLFRNGTNIKISFGLVGDGDVSVQTHKDRLSNYEVTHYARAVKNKLMKKLKLS